MNRREMTIPVYFPVKKSKKLRMGLVNRTLACCIFLNVEDIRTVYYISTKSLLSFIHQKGIRRPS